MVSFIDYGEAARMIGNITTDATVSLAKRDIDDNTIRFATGMMLITGTVMYEGIWLYQTKCAPLSLIPVIGNLINSPICAVIALATMSVTSLTFYNLITVTDLKYLDIEGTGDSELAKRDITLTDFIEDDRYHHYSNLTFWHEYFRNLGLQTTLVDDNEDALYYEDSGYLYGVNTTSRVGLSGSNAVIIQHGKSASRIFLFKEDETKYYHELCHETINAETFDFIIDEVIAKADTTYLKRLDDNTYKSEWSEDEICNSI